jgi:hypothetical protein
VQLFSFIRTETSIQTLDLRESDGKRFIRVQRDHDSTGSFTCEVWRDELCGEFDLFCSTLSETLRARTRRLTFLACRRVQEDVLERPEACNHVQNNSSGQ